MDLFINSSSPVSAGGRIRNDGENKTTPLVIAGHQVDANSCLLDRRSEGLALVIFEKSCWCMAKLPEV